MSARSARQGEREGRSAEGFRFAASQIGNRFGAKKRVCCLKACLGIVTRDRSCYCHGACDKTCKPRAIRWPHPPHDTQAQARKRARSKPQGLAALRPEPVANLLR